MISKLSKFVKDYPEHYIAGWFSEIFWPPTSVAVLVHGENEDILALDLDGSYRLPGGFIDREEEIKESAKREVKEETGYKIEIIRLLDVKHNESGGPEIIFEAKIKGGEKRGSWEGDPKFIPKRDIEEKVWKLEHSHIQDYFFPGED